MVENPISPPKRRATSKPLERQLISAALRPVPIDCSVDGMIEWTAAISNLARNIKDTTAHHYYSELHHHLRNYSQLTAKLREAQTEDGGLGRVIFVSGDWRTIRKLLEESE